MLDPATQLVNGTEYTFNFTTSGFSFSSPGDAAAEIQSKLSQIANVAGSQSLMGSTLSFTFLYVGDGSDNVSSLAALIAADLNSWLTFMSVTFAGGDLAGASNFWSQYGTFVLVGAAILLGVSFAYGFGSHVGAEI
jgi:hypothetical protein